ncbi:MAG: AI-2E family transporter, partial [Desulfobacterales bacterium]|nr:AI-2E family transporter [Desulfobacterales bacterium]
IILRTKINPTFASLITCLFIFIILFVPVVFFVSVLTKEAYELYLMGKNAVIADQIKKFNENSQIIETTNELLSNFGYQLTGDEFTKSISEVGRIVGLFLFEQTRWVASNILKFLVNFFLMLIVIFYFLIDGDRLISFITDLSPLPKDQDEKLIQKFKDMAGAILIGNGFGVLIQGAIGGIVFMLFGLNSPFLWGVIMAFLAFLPIVGIGAVFVPAAFFLFIKGRIAASIFFVVFYIILSGSIEYIFKPKIVGGRVKMHTLLVFFSIIGGLKLFGILGIIYGPLVVTAFLTLTDIYHSNYQRLIELECD